MAIAYIGIGSNLGDRKLNIENSVARINNEKGIQVLRVSSLYESDPWGVEDQPRYLNGVLEVETLLPPEGLLQRLFSIEREFGRKREMRWGPRIIDLDLLLFDELVMENAIPDGLVLPHPRMHERKFVLLPLLELVPESVHPRLKKPFKKFLRSLKDDKNHGRVEIYLR